MRSGQDCRHMTELSGDGLLALPVRLHEIELGRPVDVLLDREALRAVGLDVLCGDDVHRFLPLPTASIGADALTIHSPLVLLEEDELDFYRSRTFSLSSLRDRPVTRGRRAVGKLRDVLLAPDGGLVAVVLETGERVAFDAALAFAPEKRTAA
jgi:hypothetical protein